MNKKLTAEELDAIKALLATATPGPWTADFFPHSDDDGSDLVIYSDGGIQPHICYLPEREPFRATDACLVTALRNGAPSLIAELEWVQSELDTATAQLATVTAERDALVKNKTVVDGIIAECRRIDAEDLAKATSAPNPYLLGIRRARDHVHFLHIRDSQDPSLMALQIYRELDHMVNQFSKPIGNPLREASHEST